MLLKEHLLVAALPPAPPLRLLKLLLVPLLLTMLVVRLPLLSLALM
jgi:hypothetical protein